MTRDLLTNVHCNLIYNSQKSENNANVYQWKNKKWSIHTMEYYSAIKRNELLLYSIWLNLKKIILNETQHMQKTTYHMKCPEKANQQS